MNDGRGTRRAFVRDLARFGGAAAGLGLLAGCAPASIPSVPQARVFHVGVLRTASQPMLPLWERMSELGYTADNLVREERILRPEVDRAELAAELARLPIEVIVTFGTPATRAALAASKSIPIVMVTVTDPVGSGFVESLAQPGTNVTGVTDAPVEVDLKRLQILVEAVPTVSRVAIMGGGGPGLPAPALSDGDWESAARALGVDVRLLRFTTRQEMEAALEGAIAEGADALLVPDALGVLGLTSTVNIRRLEEQYGLPSMYSQESYAEDGGLLAYTARKADLERRAADYVDRILRGARPADLPVETPNRYDLFLNMRTARALGLTFSRDFFATVDEVIE